MNLRRRTLTWLSLTLALFWGLGLNCCSVGACCMATASADASAPACCCEAAAPASDATGERVSARDADSTPSAHECQCPETEPAVVSAGDAPVGLPTPNFDLVPAPKPVTPTPTFATTFFAACFIATPPGRAPPATA